MHFVSTQRVCASWPPLPPSPLPPPFTSLVVLSPWHLLHQQKHTASPSLFAPPPNPLLATRPNPLLPPRPLDPLLPPRPLDPPGHLDGTLCLWDLRQNRSGGQPLAEVRGRGRGRGADCTKRGQWRLWAQLDAPPPRSGGTWWSWWRVGGWG